MEFIIYEPFQSSGTTNARETTNLYIMCPMFFMDRYSFNLLAHESDVEPCRGSEMMAL